MNKYAIFLRGGTAVGKTTIAKSLAKKMHPSVHIEQDSLRYMIVNGLVASRTGLHPGTYPKEYKSQCRLADKNSLCLVRNFTASGYLVIVDGFNGGESGDTFHYLDQPEEITWYPSPESIKTHIPEVKTFQVILDTNTEILTQRLSNRKNWNEKVISFILKQREIFLQSVKCAKHNEIDLIVDTSTQTVEKITEYIIDELNLGIYRNNRDYSTLVWDRDKV